MARKKIESATDQRQFTMVYNDFIESEVLKADEKMIFIALKRFADDKGNCFPSLNKLVTVTGYSKRKVQDLIKNLEEKGVIGKENRERTDGGKGSNLYSLFDYAGMWKIKKKEDVKKLSEEMAEARMIEILTAKGYSITKKEVASDPTKEHKQLSYDTYLTNGNDTPQQSKSQEKYTLEQVRVFYDYDVMISDRPADKADIDSVIDILYDTLNTAKDTIRVNGEDKPATVVISKLMKLNFHDVFYAIDKYKEQTERIKNPKAYILTLLYGAKEQYNLDITNQVQHDMANWNK